MLTLFGMLTNVVMATSHIAEIDGINYVIYYLGGDHVNYAVVTGVSCPGAIIIPERITHRDIYDGNESTLSVRVTSISEGAFKNHNDITSVIIGGNVSKINYEAFRGCTGLTSITIPNSVYTIGNYAFEGCSSLTSVTIPNSVTSIGIEAFSGCSGLSSIVVDDGNTKYDSRNNCNAIIESSANKLIAGSNNTVIPNTITSIDTKAFSGRSGLASVTIPNSVTSIGTQAFSGCSGLSSIVVDDGNTKYDSRNNCNAIIKTESNCLITGCQNTTIPNSVTVIDSYAFEGCSSLTSISIPNSVTSIGNYAFVGSGWYNNQSDGLLYLDNWLIGYKGNEPTGEIIIKGGTKRIGTQAFYYCSSMTSITIPNSVTSIGWGAFEGCSSLTSVTVKNETPFSINSYTFPNRANTTLYVPYGCKSAYEAADYWKEFKEIVEIGTDISQMDNAIYIERTEGMAGSSVSLKVKLKNVLTPNGCAFKLNLPTGFSLVKDTDGDVVYELSDRTKKMSVTLQDWQNGSCDVALTPSTGTATISGAEGTVITFRIQIPEGIAQGDYKMNLTNNIIQSKVSGTTQDFAVADIMATFTVVDYILGDVNGDGNVTPADAIMILYDYFNVSQEGFKEAAADINGDGNITPADAIEALYIYFGVSNANAVKSFMNDMLNPE